MNSNHTAHDAWLEARQEFKSRIQVALVLVLGLEQKLSKLTAQLENELKEVAA